MKKCKLILTCLLLSMAAGNSMAQSYTPRVSFTDADPEADKWSLFTDEGSTTAIYSGNHWVNQVYATTFVDLGIVVDGKKVLWASQNLYAKTPWDYGKYYAWGEIKDKTEYKEDYSNYAFGGVDGNSSFTKYINGDYTTLQLFDDVAFITLGDDYAIPTDAEWTALCNDCYWQWTEGYSGSTTNGYAVFKKKTSGSYNVASDTHIFLPAAGDYKEASLMNANSAAWYWSSTCNAARADVAYELDFKSNEIRHTIESRRFYGFPIRAVKRKTEYISIASAALIPLPSDGETETTTLSVTNPANKPITWKSSNESVATVDSDGNITAVAEGTATIYAFCDGVTASCTITVKDNLFVPGVFSVADGKKVKFTKGNVQATTTDLGETWTWHFAEHQYDYIGNKAANTTINGNGTVSTNGTVDLFGWVGASNTTWTGAAMYGISNSQATTSTTENFGNISDETLKSDWGKAFDSDFRTLSQSEWDYLLNTTSNTARELRYLKAKVHDVNGVIIFPDGYSTTNTTITSSANNLTKDFQTLGASDWEGMENAGAVFLPAGGYRKGSSLTNEGSRGAYWTSTAIDGSTAWSVIFYDQSLNADGKDGRYSGFSVRLVHDVK